MIFQNDTLEPALNQQRAAQDHFLSRVLEALINNSLSILKNSAYCHDKKNLIQ